MKTTKKKLDFWGKFQKRLKSERSRKLKWRFSKKKSSAKEEEDNDDDLIAEANEERETTIDSLLHVLEECLTSSIVPGEGSEDLDNEIDTLSNAVLKLKQEMEGIEKAIEDGEMDKIPHFLTDKWLADTTLFGTATQVRDGVEAWFDAGIKTPILVPSSANGGQMVAFEELLAIF